MGATSAVSTQKTNVQYNFLEYTTDFTKRSSGTKDILESIGVGLQWTKYFVQDKLWNKFADRASKDLEVSQGLAIFSFATHMNDLRHHIADWGSTDKWEINKKVFDSALLAANSGSETAMFLDSIQVIQLKSWFNTAKGIFWGAAGIFDFVDFFTNIGNAESYQEIISETKDPKEKVFYESKLDFTFLKIVQNITTIAMASLMLISIFFVGIAEGFLFAPVTLGLTSAWLALNIFIYFYERVLIVREQPFLPRALSIGKV